MIIVTQLTARQVWGYYEEVGLPKNRAVAWVSVAYSESGFNTRAESPVGARGLYQFMPGSWPPQAGFYANAFDPYWNTVAMRYLSGDGMNFAPWDSAYRNINASGRYSYLAWPEAGSAVSNNMWLIAGLMGVSPPTALHPPAQPGVSNQMPAALTWYSQATHTVLPRSTAQMRGLFARSRRLYTG